MAKFPLYFRCCFSIKQKGNTINISLRKPVFIFGPLWFILNKTALLHHRLNYILLNIYLKWQ